MRNPLTLAGAAFALAVGAAMLSGCSNQTTAKSTVIPSPGTVSAGGTNTSNPTGTTPMTAEDRRYLKRYGRENMGR